MGKEWRPIREKFLQYGKQSIDEEDIKKVVEVLEGDYLTTGPYVTEFEKKVSEYVGSRYAVAVSNGTAALHMAVFAAGITEGDEVLVPAITFVATANAVLYCKGKPVFIDIDKETLNMDIDKIEEKITDRTKAIIPVDFAGNSVDIDKIMEIAKKYNLIVISDSAHGFGGEYKGEKIGRKAHMTEFSFHPVKPITTGEGGIVVTDDKKLYEKMIGFRTHGITRDKNVLINKNEGTWYYEQQYLGYNYRMTDIQAALGTSQINKIDKFINKRRKIAKRYDEAFEGIEEISVIKESKFAKSGYHIYIIKLNLDKVSFTRKEMFNSLIKENIGVNVHYYPVYKQPYYKEIGYENIVCKNAEEVYEEIITLPIFPGMNEEDIEDVINGVKKVINYLKLDKK
ncbi:MAG: UDP-4-amino-4,6-dideoxy-N-acetyl-beta-L-altrosamine transaminase [Clostridium sp.]